MPLSVEQVAADAEWFADVAAAFDDYRVAYAEPSDLERTSTWLQQMTGGGELILFAARVDGAVVGLATCHPMPASLLLGGFWMLRDLFVAPSARRGGVARALVDAAVAAATESGAIRLSLQTEPSNDPALELYASMGFDDVTGLRMLSRPLNSLPG